MKRRTVLVALACSALFARAKSAVSTKRLVIVGFGETLADLGEFEEVVRILAARGFAEGRELEIVRVVIDPARDNALQRGLDYLAPKLEREVVALKPDVILTRGSIMTKGASLATGAIPIVTSVADPVGIGVAASLARPGGNVTGLAEGLAETATKTMEMMKLLVPRLARVAIFHDPRPMSVSLAGQYERAAQHVGLEPVMVSSKETAELVRTLRSLPAKRIQAGLWAWGVGNPGEIARDAIAARVPLVAVQEPWAEAGCLASYQAFEPAPYPKLAAVVEQVLRGASPAGIPFQFPLQFRFVLNRRTAKALGLALTPEVLLRADRVID